MSGGDAGLTTARLRELVRGAEALLAEASVASPRHDALELAAACLGVDRLEWFRLPAEGSLDAFFAPGASEGFLERFAAMVERRRSREPLQRILGRAWFRRLEVEVLDEVFVPRPETEAVAQVAIDEAARLASSGRAPVVVDLCCGSGVIAVSVDVEVPGVRVWAVDASPQAVEATRVNARRLGSGSQTTLLGDVRDPGLLAELEGQVDVLVSNPPYIPPDAVPQDPEVREHDPDLALYGGGADGLEVPRAVVAAAVRLARPGALFVMEHAEVQAAAVREIVQATGAFVEIATGQDLTGRDRWVVARRSPDVEHSPS